jgi:hypothetical protein
VYFPCWWSRRARQSCLSRSSYPLLG